MRELGRQRPESQAQIHPIRGDVVRAAVPQSCCDPVRAVPRGSGESRGMMRATAEGRLLVDGTPGYDEARTVWNAMVDRRPRAIVRCETTDHVAEAIAYGR